MTPSSPFTSSVLLVEDDPQLRHVLALTLEIEGVPVITAPHGAVALRILEEGTRPCLILLDLMMPVMNGYEFLERFRQAGGFDGTPIVALSAGGELCPIPQGIRLVRKPVQATELLALVKAHREGVLHAHACS